VVGRFPPFLEHTMKLARLCLIILVTALGAAACADIPTTATPPAQPSSDASFDGGGYMGNGGRVATPPDSTNTEDGGGYMGNGG
jgi:hypothetical protein